MDGFTADGSSCADACRIDAYTSGCCIGTDACTDFTGLICKDMLSPSCSGTAACNNATIGSVLKSCVGTAACLGAASYGGSIEEIYNSCAGLQACAYLGAGGAVGKVSNSCKSNDNRACFAAGGYYANYDYGQPGAGGGEIKLGISGSCNAQLACAYATSEGGYLQFIKDGCNSDQACLNLAYQSPSIETKGKDTNRKCINTCCSDDDELQACAVLLQDNTVDDLPVDCGQCKKNLFN